MAVQPVEARNLRQARREASRVALLTAATALIAERGVDGWSIADVTKRAGKSHGLAGHHFPTKAALVQAVVEMLLERQPGDFAKGERGRIPLLEQLAAALEAVDVNATQLRARHEVLSYAHRLGSFDDLIARFYEPRVKLIEEHLESGMRVGEITGLALPESAWVIFTEHQGFELFLLRGGAAFDRQALIAAYLDRLNHSFRNWVRPEPRWDES